MPDEIDEARILNELIAAFRPLSAESRQRLLQTVATFYEIGRGGASELVEARTQAAGQFSEDRSASPKEFIHEKGAETETERLVVLAYYLTHYRGIPHFKTLDLTQLNTEAAQIKFSNAHATMHAAQTQGLIGPAPSGYKQMTARGERFVSLLPDKEAARAVVGEKRGSRKRKRKHQPAQKPASA